MKYTLAIAALAMTSLAAPAMADLTREVRCSNVPAQSGSVNGFLMDGRYFVEEASADRATVDATIVPASFDVKDGQDVVDFLVGEGATNFELVVRTSRTETQSVEVSPGVFEDQRVSVSIPAYAVAWCH